MKGLKLFLAACFVVPMLNGAMAADNTRNTPRTTQSGRGNANVSTTRKTTQQPTRQERTPAKTNTVVSRTASNKNVVTRNTQQPAPEKSRTATITPRSKTAVTARTAKKPNALARATNATFSRVATKKGTKSRAATTPTRESVMQRNFSKCKTVFFECMDEFCAQKNAQLKRCACSARAGEFTATQKSLDAVEDKLLDFSQHLLKVNMDPADAAAINTESEGERAYNNTKDKTASKKMLDEIAKKLNTDFNSAENGTGMGALSWSLNADAAFDSVDSLSGTSTTAKSGTALRNAALPVCREMAAEVCSDDDISLVENSYTMAIEQDCNTVKKAYETQVQTARTKVLEGSALLDMTRLNTYQDNNSDDILTCKSKMLDMLSNTSVCGENLTKCLDISGRYINPTTGEAFLSPELVNLSTLIVRPSSTDSWVGVPANSSFVTYLNSKKKYLESATKNCQVIADDVWDAFIEDALAQIKLAQNAKLEEVRQSCTTLLSECITKANETLENFDSRALSTFGVITDRTANAMCEKVKTSCTAIMEYNVDGSAVADNSDDRINWTDGTTDIAAMQTYDRIINTCREIGRDCIINSCKSITGNFGLCESIHGSVNRHSILSRAACWDEVKNCVAAASDESINAIHNLLGNTSVPSELYNQMYGSSTVYDFCNNTDDNDTDCASPDSIECYKCRLTEQIWGNCEKHPQNDPENQILSPLDPNKTTLLSWFAENTHTNTESDSCSISMCAAGLLDYATPDGVMCLNQDQTIACAGGGFELCLSKFCIQGSSENCTMKNCSNTELEDFNDNRCQNNWSAQIKRHTCTAGSSCPDGFYPNAPTIPNLLDPSLTLVPQTQTLCVKGQYSDATLLYANEDFTRYIFCAGTVTDTLTDREAIGCSGHYIILEKPNNSDKWYYSYPTRNTNGTGYNPHYEINQFTDADADQADGAYCQDTNQCSLGSVNNPLTWRCGTNNTPTNTSPARWRIQYPSN